MKLKDQVCSLKLAKKLKKLGIKQHSLYFWVVEMDKGRETNKWSLCPSEHLLPSHPKFSAFTVAELGDMLPAIWGEVVYNENHAVIWIEKVMGDDMRAFWTIRYFGTGSSCLHQEDEKSEANARAKMMIYLLK